MRLLLLFIFFKLSVLNVLSQTDYIQQKAIPSHPRILFFNNDESKIQTAITSNKELKKVDAVIRKEALKMLSLKLLERKQIGRRLLSVSREAIRRIMFLSYTYRMTKDMRFAKMAETEMLNISAFSDWNPSHFLDVAEMTTAMAIGYDWLFDVLKTPSKQIIKNAIIEKGLTPSFNSKHNYWLQVNHNWNQVCNAGMTLGALAVYEDEPELAKTVINRAIESIKIPMKEYGPDGAYPEGSGYWGYGTSYNILFLSAIEKIYGTYFGLSKSPGFMNTADYLLHMTAPSGNTFNYADNGKSTSLNTPVFWFSDKNKNPELLKNEWEMIKNDTNERMASDRLLPTLLIWGKDLFKHSFAIPKNLMWVGGGLSPVAMMRSSWTDKRAIYLGFKSGSANVNHAHMDVGSFIMEADGVRWAMDFGMQNYESLESKGMSIFGRTQYAQRWSIFRYINTSHNTLTINDSLHRVNGTAEITRYSYNPSFMFAQSDITEVFGGDVKKSVRGVAIKNKNYVIVQDEVVTATNPVKLRWSMVTPADVRIKSDNEIILNKNDKNLLMQIQSIVPVQIKTWSTKPVTDYDAENPGTVIVGFEVQLPANTTSTIVVNLIPLKKNTCVSNEIIPLSQWK